MKRVVLKVGILSVIVLLVFLGVIFIRKPEKNVKDILDEIVNKYDKVMESYINKIDETIVSSGGISFLIDSMVMEEDGLVIKYELADKELDMKAMSISSIACNNANQSVNVDASLNFKSRDNVYIAIFKFNNESMKDFINNTIDFNLSIVYAENRPNSGAITDFVKFSYAPTKFYTPKKININQSINVDHNLITLRNLTIHHLYTSIEVETESNDGSFYVIELKNQNGVRITPISGEIQGNVATFYFEGIDKEVTSIFAEPKIYSVNKEKDKLDLKPVQVQPIEIRLDE